MQTRRILTSIFLSSMALGSLRTSMRAEAAEYSMLKGRPVSPSLSSLMAFVLSDSVWGGGAHQDSTGTRSGGRLTHLSESGEELGHDGKGGRDGETYSGCTEAYKGGEACDMMNSSRQFCFDSEGRIPSRSGSLPVHERRFVIACDIQKHPIQSSVQ